jgi:hypothetical protein
MPASEAFWQSPECFPRWGAGYFLWRKESNQRKLFTSNSNLPSEPWPGFFDKTSMSCRKTADILSAALRVTDCGIALCSGTLAGTMAALGAGRSNRKRTISGGESADRL